MINAFLTRLFREKYLPCTLILKSQFSSEWHCNALRFFRTALMAVDVSLHGIPELYCIVVDDDRWFGKVVSIRHKSILLNYLPEFFNSFFFIINRSIFLLPHAGVSPFQVYPVLGPHLYSFSGKLFWTNEYPGLHPTSQTRCSFLSEQFNIFPKERTRTGHADSKRNTTQCHM